MLLLHACVHRGRYRDRVAMRPFLSEEVPEPVTVACSKRGDLYIAELDPYDEPPDLQEPEWDAVNRLETECPDHAHAFETEVLKKRMVLVRLADHETSESLMPALTCERRHLFTVGRIDTGIMLCDPSGLKRRSSFATRVEARKTTGNRWSLAFSKLTMAPVSGDTVAERTPFDYKPALRT